MPIKTKEQLEAELSDSVKRSRELTEANRALKDARLQPEPDVRPQNVSVERPPLQGIKQGQG